jgi:hypothetical protein
VGAAHRESPDGGGDGGIAADPTAAARRRPHPKLQPNLSYRPSSCDTSIIPVFPPPDFSRATRRLPIPTSSTTNTPARASNSSASAVKAAAAAASSSPPLFYSARIKKRVFTTHCKQKLVWDGPTGIQVWNLSWRYKSKVFLIAISPVHKRQANKGNLLTLASL